MFDLTADQHNDLQRLARVGERGLRLGDEISLCTALHFGVHGLATITNGGRPPQSAVITERGRAFSFRTAA